MKQVHLLLVVSLLMGPAAAWCGSQLPRPCPSSLQHLSRSSLLPLAASHWQRRKVGNGAGRSNSLGKAGGDARAPLNEIPDVTLLSARRATLGKECD